MTTTLYFHAPASAVAGTLPSSTQSGLSFTGSGGDAQSVNRSMTATIGSSQTSLAVTSAANTSTNHYYFTRFVSPPLAAQTIPSGTSNWSYDFGAKESNNSANFPVTTSSVITSICVYVWRPGTGALVGTIVGGSSSSSYSEASTSESALSGTFSGASVVCQAGDVICMEIIFTTTQGSSSSYTDTFYYDGTTTNSTSSNAAYLSTTQTLYFYNAVALADTVTLSDHLTVIKFFTLDKLVKRALHKPATEVIGAVTDALVRVKTAKNVVNTRSAADILTVTDPLKKKASRFKTDAIVVTDSTTRLRRVPTANTDLATITEALQKLALHTKTEAVGVIGDGLKKKIAFCPTRMTEALGAITDSIGKKALHKMVEALGLVTDPIVKSKHLFRALTTEAVGLVTDSAKKKALKSLAEVTAVLESLGKRVWHKLTIEALVIGESKVKLTAKTLVQTTGAITDSIKRKIGRALSDLIVISEIVQRGILRKMTESITIGDSLLKTHRFLRALVQVVRTIITGTGS